MTHNSQSVSLDSLLREMTDGDSLARYPAPAYTTRQASSYDRRSVAPNQSGWWANDDFSQYIRTDTIEGRQEHVMLDAQGPGAIVRFWLTVGGSKEGTLRVYFDGNPRPSLVFTAFDLEAGPLKIPSALMYRHSSYGPESGGQTLYLPLPYARSCKVTWESSRRSNFYYHLNYRTYAPGTRVTTWTPQAMDAVRSLIERTAQILNAPSQAIAGRITSLNQSLAPRTLATLKLPAGPCAVRALELVLDSSHLAPAEVERTLRSVIIQLTFDGERTVWCPTTDFFGSGVGLNELRNFYQTVSRDGTLRCRWVMPYRKSAQITLLNLGAAPILATLHATTAPWQWDARSMHFHANWHFESGLKPILVNRVLEPTTGKDWNFVTLRGRGVYVGDSLALFNPVATWYGEGDEKISVDGEAFPSHMGTGTEDYYGYSYAPRPTFQTPFFGLSRLDSPSTQGYNVMGRTRPLDAIPFEKSLHFDIELIAWAPTMLTYAATTYWYGFPGATSNVSPQPTAATRPVQTLAEALAPRKLKPGAIEVESLAVLAHAPSFTPEVQEMSPWDASLWSSGHQLLGKAQRVGDFVELSIPAPDQLPRQIILHPTQAPDYGILRFTVNGQPSAAIFDGYAPQVQPGTPLKLGVFAPQDGHFVLRVEVSDSNPQAIKEGTLFGLDYVELTAP